MDPQVAIHSDVGSIRRSLPELNCSTTLKAFIRFTTPDPADCVLIVELCGRMTRSHPLIELSQD